MNWRNNLINSGHFHWNTICKEKWIDIHWGIHTNERYPIFSHVIAILTIPSRVCPIIFNSRCGDRLSMFLILDPPFPGGSRYGID